jgi:hypothetical protein
MSTGLHSCFLGCCYVHTRHNTPDQTATATATDLTASDVLLTATDVLLSLNLGHVLALAIVCWLH